METELKLLFVDDEPQVLSALSRSVSQRCPRWTCFTATNGHEALQLLAKQPFDVVVTDLLMPGLDGNDLGREVLMRYPWIARIVLTGVADAHLLTMGTTWSQRMLSKACTPDDLFAAIREVVGARDRDRAMLDATMPAKVAQRPVILHIEADLEEAAIFRRAVEAFTAEIILRQVADGRAGLAYLAHIGEFALAPTPHLILIDVDIPSMNGYEFLARYRGAGHSVTTVIGLTSSPNGRKSEEAILHGAACILTKPSTWDRYLELARKVVLDATQSALAAPRKGP